jgi:hypothetical protein
MRADRNRTHASSRKKRGGFRGEDDIKNYLATAWQLRCAVCILGLRGRVCRFMVSPKVSAGNIFKETFPVHINEGETGGASTGKAYGAREFVSTTK